MAKGPLSHAPEKRTARKGSRNPAILGLDGRTKASRRFRDICGALTVELEHEPSQGELGLIRQVALSIVLSEQIQSRALSGQALPAELGEIARLGNLVTRGLLALGVTRGDKQREPDLKTYLAGKPKAAAP